MEHARGPAPPAEGGGLDAKVLTTLQAFPGRVAFSGLRRVLGSHPESLSRSLRRLEREGLVERVDGGYRALALPPVVDERSDRGLRSIAEIDLPPGTSAAALLGRLAGRWFGSLRWVGFLERPEGELLAWARREGGPLILLGLRANVLRVYAPNPGVDDDPGESEEAAYELLYHAVDALRPMAAAPPETSPALRAFLLEPGVPLAAS